MAIDFDRILISLFYLFAFSLSFELVFELFLSIETIFKPFRIVALFIVGVYGLKVLKQGVHLNRDDIHDVWLYGVFAYGLIISCVRIVSGPFSMSHFSNDVFQAVLLLAIFFIFKSTPMSIYNIHRCIKSYLWGVACNASYILFNLFILDFINKR